MSSVIVYFPKLGLQVTKMSDIENLNFNINPHIDIESQSKQLVRSLSELNVISLSISPKDESKIAIKKFTDGISNILVGVYQIDNPDHIIMMIRIYGEAVSNIVDRNKEMESMVLLNSVGLSSKLYAKFENGFCYEYLRGEVLDIDRLRDKGVAKLVARSIAKLHSLNPCQAADVNGQESNLIKRMRKVLELIPNDLVIEPVDRISNGHDANDNEQSLIQGRLPLTDDGLLMKELLAKEVDYIARSELIRNEKDIVFCHNDTLPRNLILSHDETKVLIIDLEYADYNGRGFELANHFLEFCGMDFDTSKYPNESFIRMWIENYVGYIKQNGSSQVIPDEVELYVKIQKYACISSLFWALWAFYMSSDETMSGGFDYKVYAVKRLEDYYLKRNALS